MTYKKLSEIKPNPDNPRVIRDENFQKLVNSIKEFPEMLDLRPIVVNKDMVILGGNMRYRACQEAGYKEVPVVVADNITREQEREFIVKDNVSGGEWDWEVLANEWDAELLNEWGLDVPSIDDVEKTSDIPKDGEIEFSEELLLEHNYIVLYFDNPLDWEVAIDKYGLKKVKTNVPEGSQKVGIGRVVRGADFL